MKVFYITQKFFYIILILFCIIFFFKVNNSFADAKLSKKNQENISLIGEAKFHKVETENETIKKIALSEKFIHQIKPNALEIINFIKKNPHWPTLKLLLEKVETNLNENIDLKLIYEFLTKYPPSTNNGLKYYALSLLTYKSQMEYKDLEILRKAWIYGDFSELELINFTYRLNNIDSKKIKNLLKKTNNKTKNLKIQVINEKVLEERLANLVKNSFVSKFNEVTRNNLKAIAVIAKSFQLNWQSKINSIIKILENEKDTKRIYFELPKKLQQNSVISFLYLKYIYLNKKKETSDSDLNLLISTKKPKALQKKWWNIINYYVREYLFENDLNLSLKLINSIDFDQEDHAFDVLRGEHLFLKGFLQYKLKNYKNSLKTFSLGANLTKNTRLLAKFQYWQGQAAKQLKQKDLANQFFNSAAQFHYNFYGQMAMKELKISLTKEQLTKNIHSKVKFNNKYKEALHAVQYLLKYSKNPYLKERYALGLINEANNLDQKVLLYKIIAQHQQYNLNVELANFLMKQYKIFLIEGYPIKTFKTSYVDTELAHAIIRQESSFVTRLKAKDGGLGIMQLMPTTIKMVSNNLKTKIEVDKLTTDPDYNVQFGTFYLNRNVELFQSYLMGIYSYNCGRSKMLSYKKNIFADFHKHKNDIEILKIIEKFPITISREYGQKVCANYLIYLILKHGKLNFSNMTLNSIRPIP